MLHKESKYIFEEYREPQGCLCFVSVILVLVVFILFCLVSCKTQAPLVEFREVVKHDTTLLHDSIYNERVRIEYQQGDTVFVRDSVFLYKYKYLDKVQIEYLHDSIPYKVEVTKEVRRRNGYDKATSAGFWSLLAFLLAFAAWKIVKRYYLRI